MTLADAVERVKERLASRQDAYVDCSDCGHRLDLVSNTADLSDIVKATIEALGYRLDSRREIYDPRPAPPLGYQPSQNARWIGSGRRRR